jgi:hypothetical protein
LRHLEEDPLDDMDVDELQSQLKNLMNEVGDEELARAAQLSLTEPFTFYSVFSTCPQVFL